MINYKWWPSLNMVCAPHIWRVTTLSYLLIIISLFIIYICYIATPFKGIFCLKSDFTYTNLFWIFVEALELACVLWIYSFSLDVSLDLYVVILSTWVVSFWNNTTCNYLFSISTSGFHLWEIVDLYYEHIFVVSILSWILFLLFHSI